MLSCLQTTLFKREQKKEGKRAISNIYSRIFDLGLTVRVGAKLRC